ncbi:Calx-beta domain-containing protein [Humitalea rosea]|uniref:Calx-beta domain-containing protein n=1 Tax=Humitalea rosea TaxID=990373 RepID=A0A2W7IRM9_9PROT|nr:Calx-beta domain-containing protein [Humitalea rosea]PZW49086.1 Calx-beta domain-containing protein [Humitalea rosea]
MSGTLPLVEVRDIVVGEKDGLATFVFALNAASANQTSIRYSWDYGTAGSQDFGSFTGTITFAAGETSKSIQVAITDDAIIEEPESFHLTLGTPVGLGLARTSATATILDNDRTDRAPLVSVTDTAVNESDGFAYFVVTLDRAAGAPVTVAFQTANGSATAGADFTTTQGSIVFAPGETAKTIAVPLLNDAAIESDESFDLILTGVTGPAGTALADARGTATLSRSDATPVSLPMLTVDDVSISEGSELNALTFVFRLSAPSANQTSVRYSWDYGTAGSQDFQGFSGTITFAPGETSKTILVSVLDDALAEMPETFHITLGTPVGLVLSQGWATATIIDNDRTDRAPLASVGDTGVNESDGFAHFVITLDRAATTPVVVNYQTANGTAAAGTDFLAKQGTVVFAPGETSATVAVQILDEGAAEADETFDLVLTGISGPAGTALADARGTAIIARSDTGPLSLPLLTVDDVSVSETNEAGTVTFLFRLSAPSANQTSATYSWDYGTAGSQDFGGFSGTIVFAPGETLKSVQVNVIDDAVAEGPETFRLTLGSPTGLVLGRSSATATIIDNDRNERPPLVFVTDTTVNESDGFAHFALTLDRAATTPVTVNFQAATGSAVAGQDFVPTQGSVVFSPGETSATVSVHLLDDAIAEGEERFDLLLTGASGTPGIAVADGRGSALISRSDTAPVSLPTLSVDDVTVAENGPNGTVTFVFRLNATSASQSSVRYSWDYGTAGSQDFEGFSGTMVFAPGETSRAVQVNIIDDALSEQPETFLLTLGSATGLVLARTSATATIIDNDTPGAALAYGPGDDVYVLPNAGTPVTELPGGGIDTIVIAESIGLPANVENLTLYGTGAANGDGNELDNYLRGNDAANVLRGFGGNDTLDGGLGADRLEGGAGNDTYFVNNAAVVVVEALGGGHDVISATVSYTAPIEVEDLFLAGSGDISATGNGLANLLIGNAGNNLLGGLGGNDTLLGAAGNDTLNGGDGFDVVDLTGIGRRGSGFALSGGTLTHTHGAEVEQYIGIEEIRFADGRVVLDAADPAAQVLRLYQAGLGRGPDQGGLNFWIGHLQHGTGNLGSLAQGFLGSDEFAARFGTGLSNAAFVDTLYHNVLGRGPDVGGQTYWEGVLGAGVPRADVLVSFSESPENKQLTAPSVAAGIWDLNENAAVVARIYDTVFGRLPDVGGLSFWRDALDAGAISQREVAASFVGSPEFQAKYGALGNQDFAAALYVNTLDRAPDAGGLAYWTNTLNAGVPRVDVVLDFSESPEHVALTAPSVISESPASYGILFV